MSFPQACVQRAGADIPQLVRAKGSPFSQHQSDRVRFLSSLHLLRVTKGKLFLRIFQEHGASANVYQIGTKC